MSEHKLNISITATDHASQSLNAARENIAKLTGGVTRAHREIAGGMDSISAQLERTKAQFIGLFMVAPQIGALGRAAFDAAESFKSINARLQNATQGALDFNQAQTATVTIAKSTGASLDSIAGLYGKLRLNAGMAAADAEKLTAILAKATQLDGGGQGAQAALFQLQQGLASGTLRGEELNSVLEQTPTLALQMAKGLNVAQGDLRKLAEDGKLTADAVKQALFAQTGAIDEMFSRLPVTAARAFENIKTAAIQEFGQIDAALGVTSGMGAALQAISEHFRAITAVAVAATGTITAAWLQSIATRRAAEVAAHLAAMAEIVQRKEAEVLAARATLAAATTGSAATAAQTALAGAASGLVAARSAAAAAAAPVSLLTRLVTLLGAAFRFLTGPIGLAVTAISALTGYLIANRDEVHTVGGSHVTIAEGIRAAWQLVAQSLARVMQFISTKAGITGGDIRLAFGGAFAAVLAVAKTMVNGVVGAFIYVGGSIGNIAGSIANRFRIVFQGITDMAGGLWQDVKAALTGDTTFKQTSAAFGRAMGAGIRDAAQTELAQSDLLKKAFNTDHAGKTLNNMGSSLAAQVQKNRDAAANAQAEDWFNEKPSASLPSTSPSLAAAKKQKGVKAKDSALADAFWADIDAEQAALMQGRQTAAMRYALEQEAILNSIRETNEDFARQVSVFEGEGIIEARTVGGADVLAAYDAQQQRLAAIRQRLDAEVTLGAKTQSAAQLELRRATQQLGEELGGTLIPRLQTLISTAPDEVTREKWRALYAEINSLRAAGQQTGTFAGLQAGLTQYGETISDTFASAQEGVTRAFAGMETALVSFVQTGKLDFKSLADSLIADMIRLQVQQSITKPLAAALGSWLGGTATVTAATGGLIAGPGSGTSDSIPAWLSNGEYVIKADVVQRLGAGFFDQINAGAPRFASGGLVGSTVGSTSVDPARLKSPPQVTVNITNAAGPHTQASARERTDSSGNRMIEVLIEQVKGAIAGDIAQGRGAVPAAIERTYGANRLAGAY